MFDGILEAAMWLVFDLPVPNRCTDLSLESPLHDQAPVVIVGLAQLFSALVRS